MLTEDMLADLGYEIAVTAANLESGLQSATGGNFEVGMLDINLHGRQSYPIANILEERRIPLAFVSGYAAKGIEARFARIPILQKPFTATALGDVLARALGG